MEKVIFGIVIISALLFLMVKLDDSYQKQVKQEVESRGYELCSVERRVLVTPWIITKNYHIYRFVYKEKDQTTAKIGWVRFGFGTEWKWNTQD